MFRTPVLAILAIATVVSGNKLLSIFDFLPRAELFPACLKTVSATLAQRAPQTPITTEDAEPLCENIIISAPNSPGSRTTAVLADCAELSGRMEEAAKNGYLNDGSEFCGNILKQNAKEHDIPLVQYVPRGVTSKKKFCEQFSGAVEACSGVEAGITSKDNDDGRKDLSPSAVLLHSAEAMDAPAMPHQAAVADSITNMVAAPPTGDEQHPSKMTPQYMKKNFGSILRFGGGSDGQ